MVDTVRNKQHGNGGRNDNTVAEGDQRRHEERKRRLEQEERQLGPKEAPPGR
ncbi:MAG TPA: hypothetical protein VN624_12900 [Rhodanobacter sp.]|jgi:hypothetical protein|nr:hypothetical protein [Rhodanobacter sp.]